MRQFVNLVAAWLVATALGQADAGDRLAKEYAAEAVATLTANVERLQSARSVSQAQLEQARNQLFEAQLLTARLNGDHREQQSLLRGRVDSQQKRLDRVQQQAKRGYAGLNDLRIARLQLLFAQQQLALVSEDEQAVSAIVNSAVEIESNYLSVLRDQSSRGYAGSAKIVDQKLRIAQMIANRRIPLAAVSQ
jgi:hypothetical protein